MLLVVSVPIELPGAAIPPARTWIAEAIRPVPPRVPPEATVYCPAPVYLPLTESRPLEITVAPE